MIHIYLTVILTEPGSSAQKIAGTAGFYSLKFVIRQIVPKWQELLALTRVPVKHSET